MAQETTRTVVVWVVEGTWPACVDAAKRWAPDDAELVLLHVGGGEAAAAQGALAGLLGRGQPGRGSGRRDPSKDLDALSESAVAELLDRAARRLGRPARTERLTAPSHPEHTVVAATEDAGAELLVCARDGDRSRLGPRSLGRAGRFVVDHAPCPVLLVWPEETPDVASIPPPPPPGHEPRHPDHG